MRRFRAGPVVVWGALLGACTSPNPSSPNPPSEQAPSAPALSVGGPDAAAARWLAIGGGPRPDQNEVSIEQDLQLAAEVFGPEGRVLYAGGPGSRAVQVAGASPPIDPLRAELAALFAPRGGRGATYRETTLRVHDPAWPHTVRRTLTQALTARGAPLVVYVAGHGDEGETARDTAFALWGDQALSVGELAEALDAAAPARRLCLVATTCYSGGFGELVFQGADPTSGPAVHDRCGLFAATADLPAAGCDPNPDRKAQEGYGLLFLPALRGRSPEQRPLPAADLDFDQDGAISLLEAHTYTRIHARSADVPTSTSERWLREVAPREGPRAAVILPEEDAVVAALGARLGMPSSSAVVQIALAEIESQIEAKEAERQAALDAESAAYAEVSGELLHRWPVIDDPWHPAFAATLQRDGPAIAARLRSLPAYARLNESQARADDLDAEVWQLRRRAAPIERLFRALETRELAGRLRHRGGRDWEIYERVLGCERSLPPERSAITRP